MPNRRILSLWFPRLGADRLLRQMDAIGDTSVLPFAVVRDIGNTQVLSSLSLAASAVGLHVGQPLRDAHAMCPALITRLQNPQAEAAFLQVLRRWAGKFSPWVAAQDVDGLVLDITGCAHLFGGEQPLMTQAEEDCSALGLHVQAGIADTVGAAWALARFAGQPADHARSGDAVDQEARATRSRAAKRRHWERGGAAPTSTTPAGTAIRIAPPGQVHSALAGLPVAALRLEPTILEQLTRLGLRRIGDLTGQPRAPLARRFGRELVLRLDQAMGSTPEPVSPAAADPVFATRLTLPEPIGLEADLLAGLDRLLPRLCEMLRGKGRGARTVRLQAFRTDQTMQWITTGLARPSDQPDRIRPLLAMKLSEIDAGFGIDMLRVEAIQTEPLHIKTRAGHMDATRAARDRLINDTGMDDLIGRIGARVGMDAITRYHPGNSHIPEKGAQTLAAAWSEPAADWPASTAPRPLLLWPPELVNAADTPTLSARFRWRGKHLDLACARGPERISPEWWLDDPNWRSGVRDYWHVITGDGSALWLYYAHGASMSAGWFCHGSFD